MQLCELDCRNLTGHDRQQRAQPLGQVGHERERGLCARQEVRVVADRDQLGAALADLLDRAAHALERPAARGDHDRGPPGLQRRYRSVQKVGRRKRLKGGARQLSDLQRDLEGCPVVDAASDDAAAFGVSIASQLVGHRERSVDLLRNRRGRGAQSLEALGVADGDS